MIKPLPPKTLAWMRQAAALDGDAYSQLILHILERLEALEKHPIPTPEAAPTAATDGGLVERVTNVLGHYGDGAARAVIREVAAWLNERDTSIQNDPGSAGMEAPSTDDAIRWLREEADR